MAAVIVLDDGTTIVPYNSSRTGPQMDRAMDGGDSVGNLTNLTTTEKSSVVGAINEVNGGVINVKRNLFALAQIATDIEKLYNYGTISSITTASKNIRWILSKSVPAGNIINKVEFTASPNTTSSRVTIELFEKIGNKLNLINSFIVRPSIPNEHFVVYVNTPVQNETFISILTNVQGVLGLTSDSMGCDYISDIISTEINVSDLQHVNSCIALTVDYFTAKTSPIEHEVEDARISEDGEHHDSLNDRITYSNNILATEIQNITKVLYEEYNLYNSGDVSSSFSVSRNIRWILGKSIPENNIIKSIAMTSNENWTEGNVYLEIFEKTSETKITKIKSLEIQFTSPAETVEIPVNFSTTKESFVSLRTTKVNVISTASDSSGMNYTKDTTSDELLIGDLSHVNSSIAITVKCFKQKNFDVNFTNVLKGKKIALIGDSITEYNIKAKTNWSMWLENWTGAVIQNLGISGTGFAKKNPYKNRISNIDDDTDLIGIAISFNDMSAEMELGTVDDVYPEDVTVAGYANTLFSELIAAFPSTPVICYVQSPWGVYKPGIEKSDTWVELMKQICIKHCIPFNDSMYWGSILRPWNTENQQIYYKADNDVLPDPNNIYGTTDRTHPNSEGHKVIARRLMNMFIDNIVDSNANYK